jgi:hypothetical protein
VAGLGTKLKSFVTTSFVRALFAIVRSLQVAVRRGNMKLVWGDPYMITKEADLNGTTSKSISVKGTS